MKRVICCGYLCCDLAATTDGYPEENQKTFIDSLHVSAGGPAANAACLLAQWGVETYFFGQLGNGSFSDIVLNDLHHFGVRTDFIQRYHGPVNTAMIITNANNGSRTVLSKKVSNAFPLTELPTMPDIDGVLLDGHQFEWSRRLLARQPAVSVLDAGSFRDETLDLLNRVSDPVASNAFFQSLQKKYDTSDGFYQAFGTTLVVTDGERPVREFSRTGVLAHPVIQVTAVDTLAAGDCFHGAYLFGRLHGLCTADTILLAATAAGICVTRQGGCHSFPLFSETLNCLQNQQTPQATTLYSKTKNLM